MLWIQTYELRSGHEDTLLIAQAFMIDPAIITAVAAATVMREANRPTFCIPYIFTVSGDCVSGLNRHARCVRSPKPVDTRFYRYRRAGPTLFVSPASFRIAFR